MSNFNSSEVQQLPKTLSPFVQEIILKLLDKDPLNRPDAATLLQMNEFKLYI